MPGDLTHFESADSSLLLFSCSVASDSATPRTAARQTSLSFAISWSLPGLGRSPGEGNGYQVQYSCLEKSMDRGAWRAYSPWGRTESNMTKLPTLNYS